ncbi:MAG: hypothetical protein KDI13_11175 [Alphaproteobacteria bacterium]|nr:hypothetical protein [Alphaproteobacteria bacterium]
MTNKNNFERPWNEMRDWQNDDLLISSTARETFQNAHPKAFEVLDWPELRAYFMEHEKQANKYKHFTRHSGHLAVISAFIALIGPNLLMALNLSTTWHTALGLIIFLAASLTLFLSLTQLLNGKNKKIWMASRFKTETIRRFFYQFLLQNFECAAAAMTNQEKLDELREKQQKAFSALQLEYLSNPQDCLLNMLSQNNSYHVPIWLSQKWTDKTIPKDIPEEFQENAELLLDILRQKRLDVQYTYSLKKLEGAKLSLQKKVHILKASFVFLALLLMGCVAVLGFQSAFFNPADLMPISFCIGVLSTLIVTLQMYERGCNMESEKDRMSWFNSSVDRLRSRYINTENTDEKLGILIEFEELVYQEMVHFFTYEDRIIFIAI